MKELTTAVGCVVLVLAVALGGCGGGGGDAAEPTATVTVTQEGDASSSNDRFFEYKISHHQQPSEVIWNQEVWKEVVALQGLLGIEF